MTDRRLIEEAFPLKKVSEHSQDEQWVSQGKPNSLLYWPARRPLAASRAAAIAALLPDPGDERLRIELGRKIESITAWGSESGPTLDFFRQRIREAFGGRAPRVLDPFAGGGAIPLETMRLGCEVIANDYNPVAWFILKCTLEFPLRLVGKTWPLPSLPPSPSGRGAGGEGGARGEGQLHLLPEAGRPAGLPDHVRFWGRWVLARARADLASYYPVVDGQPTVAYLWARTVPCPDPACGAEVPLLKTLWLCKKAEKTLPATPENERRPDFLRLKRVGKASKVIVNARRALRLIPHKGNHRVDFAIYTPAPDEPVLPGTMAGAKTACPVCTAKITSDYIKRCGHAGKLGARMTAVVVQGAYGKEYRLPMLAEEDAARRAAADLPTAATQIPHGLPTEPLPESGTSGAGRAFTVPQYGFKTWADLFTPRQLLALVTLVKHTRAAGEEMSRLGYPLPWIEAVTSYSTLTTCKVADYNCCCAKWQSDDEAVSNLFTSAKLPIMWDFVEINAIGESVSSYQSHLQLQQRVLDRLCVWPHAGDPQPKLERGDATKMALQEPVDLVFTDPPYYDEVPYGDVSDFFYVWMRRAIGDRYADIFGEPLTAKSRELVDYGEQAVGRMGRVGYETGMAEAFGQARANLKQDGHMVVVFAHKEPTAWETLVTAIIHAGFVVTASWPIDTEKRNRSRAMNSAALSSSVWMVFRKRPAGAGVGRYSAVRRAMEARVTERLRYFWDLGISGPDFVWAAVGPALESYSAYDEVRRLDGAPFTVAEFLREVRRIVADFSLGQILHGGSTEGLDEWTRYYLLHRAYFGLEPGPIGECILYSQGYGLDLNDLRGPRGFLLKAARKEESDDEAGAKSSGSGLRLARWDERSRDDLGEPHSSGVLPIIDMLHRLMRLWKAGRLDAVEAYAAEKGLRQNETLWAVAQAVLEMAPPGNGERSLLEAIVAWGRGGRPPSASAPRAEQGQLL